MKNVKASRIFSRGLYFEGLRRTKLAGIIFFAVLLFEAIMIPAMQIVSYNNRADMGGTMITQSVTFLTMHGLAYIIPYMLAPILTLTAFGFLNRRASSDFYHSLPHSRTSLFFSTLAAIVSWIVFDLVVTTGVGLVIHLCYPAYFTVNIGGIALAVASLAVMSLLVVAGTSIAMSVTGTYLNCVIIALLILLAPRGLISVVTGGIAEQVRIVGASQLFPLTAIDYNLVVSALSSGFGVSPLTDALAYIPGIFYTLVLSLVYFAAAWLLFMRRRSETAEHSAPSRRVQAFYRITLTTLFCSFISLAVFSGVRDFTLVILIGVALLIYFIYELVTTHSFRALPKTLPGLGLVLVFTLAIYGVMVGGKALVLSYKPSADAIDEVRLIEGETRRSSWSYSFAEYAASKTSTIPLTDGESRRIVSEALAEAVDTIRSDDDSYSYHYYSTDVDKYTEASFAVKSGLITRRRNINVKSEELRRLADTLANYDEYREIYTDIPAVADENSVYVNSGFTGESLRVSASVVDTLRRELQSVEFSDWYMLLRDGQYGTSGSIISLQYKCFDGAYTYTITVPVSASILPQTMQAIASSAAASNYSRSEMLEMLRYSIADFDEHGYSDSYDSERINSATATLFIPDGTGGYRVYNSYFGVDKNLFRDIVEATDPAAEPDISKGFMTVVAYTYTGNSAINNRSAFFALPEGLDLSAFDGYYEYGKEYNGYYENDKENIVYSEENIVYPEE